MMKVKKAIIPAAGLGTRFLPITKAVPKPMLSVLDKPTIQFIAEELESIGIEDIVIVVSPDSDVIKRHFTPNEQLSKRLLSDGKTTLYTFATEDSRYLLADGTHVQLVDEQGANTLFQLEPAAAGSRPLKA